MYSDKTDFETDAQLLQETKGCFIVLDRNNCLVFCNEALNAIYSEAKQLYTLPSDSFWLKSEQRIFDVNEFNSLIGNEVELLFKSKLNRFTEVKLTIKELETPSQKYLAVSYVEEPNITLPPISKTQEMLIDQLVKDLNNGKFSVHYQPQINTINRELFGIEALCRWDRGQEETISPDVFVALAEDFNFISELDIWVLDQVCQQLTKWQDKGIEIPMTSVNFSPVSLNNLNTHSRILATLDKHKIPADKITIEITEGKKIYYCDAVISSLHNLNTMGITFSLDDFGIGYSNFKRLTRIPVSQLKLDRSFVLNLPNKLYKEISASTLSIGKKLGLSVIAEGVENTEQLEILEDLGCQIYQGYMFSKPLPEADFENWFFNISNRWDR